MSFPLHELSSALEYVRRRSVITRGSGDSERPTIYATGFGCIQHGKLIANTFSVRYVFTPILSVLVCGLRSPRLPSNSDKKSWIVVTVYGYRRPTVVTAPTSSITHCVQAATSWVRSNRLQPNPDKIEVQWRATAKGHNQLPTSPLLIDG